MATSSLASGLNREPAHQVVPDTTSSAWVSIAFLCAGLLAVVGYYWAPTDANQRIWAGLLDLGVAVAIFTGMRLYLPEARRSGWLLASAFGLLAGGTLLQQMLAMRAPAIAVFPSPADGLLLLHYPLLILGLAGLLWRSDRPHSAVDALDATIVTLGIALLWWVSFIVPSATDAAQDAVARIVRSGYPLFDIGVLALLAWMLVVTGPHSRAFQLIRVGLACRLVASAWTVMLANGGPLPTGGLIDIGWLVSAVCLGAAALHPSVAQFSAPVSRSTTSAPGHRMLLLGAAAMLVPAALAIEAVRSEPLAVPALVVGTGLLVLLGALRIQRLSHTLATTLPKLEHAESRERVVMNAATTLRLATNRDAICAAGIEAIGALVDDDTPIGIHIALGNKDQLNVVASGGDVPSAPIGAAVDLNRLSGELRVRLATGRAIRIEPADFPDLAAALGFAVPVDTIIWVSLFAEHEARGAIIVTSAASLDDETLRGIEAVGSQTAIALERAALAADLYGRHSEARFRSLVRNASDIITVLEPNGTIRYASPAVERILGYKPAGLIGSQMLDLVHPDDQGLVAAFALKVYENPQETSEVEVRLRPEVGDWKRVEAIGNNLLGDTSVGGLVVTWRDISERTEAQRALQESEAHYRALVDTAFDAIITLTSAGYILSYNRGAERVFGYTAKEAIGRSLDFLIPEPWDALQTVGMAQSRDSEAASIERTFELEGKRKNGAPVPVEMSFTEVHQASGQIFTSILRDISERKAFEGQLAHQAFHDTLTSLPNRALFMERLEHALTRARRRGTAVAVIFLDLDRFKFVNDSQGHTQGDALLVEVGQRLSGCIRAEDTASRFGGDEFAILLEDITDTTYPVGQAVRVVERIQKALTRPFELGGREFMVSASIGIATSDEDATDATDLLRYADLAMYRAKHAGKARYEVFDQSMSAIVLERLENEVDLRAALERQEFYVVYQPKVELSSGRVAEMEALVRWQHPHRGLISPADFIPVAEETGLIVAIGAWVLEEACRQTRDWHANFPTRLPLGISVNLSGRQFEQLDLVETVARVLRETGLPPECLKLEITESVVMENGPSTIVKLRELKELGVKLSIDDFGTGYSSLSYLKRFPVDNLKIDRSFVTGLGRNAEDTAIVQAVITLAHTLGLSVTAEGVETADEVRHLHALGCELGQGYFFAKPLACEAAAKLLNQMTQTTQTVRVAQR